MFFREKCDRVQYSSVIVLRQYTGRDKIRRVCFQDYLLGPVKRFQNRGRCKRLLQGFEAQLADRCPFETDVFLRESHERGDDFREVSDKAAVEVAETNKGLHISQTGRCFPVHDRFDLVGVHTDTIFTDDNTKELRLGHTEFAFR